MIAPMPITTEAEYDAALARLDTVIFAKLGTPEYDEMDALADAVEAYERVLYRCLPTKTSAQLDKAAAVATTGDMT